MAKKSKDKQVTHIEKDDLKARQAAINEAIKVIEKELPSKDINLFINQAINNSEDWYKESEK